MKNKNKATTLAAMQAFAEKFTSQHPTKQHLMKLEYQLGIDEAGRGPVLGSMVYSALWWPKAYREQLAKFGFTDSKVLNEEKREQLYELILKLKDKVLFFQIEELTPQYLSKKMLAFEPTNLNVLSHNAAIKLLRNALQAGFNITQVYVDTVGDPNKYREYIRSRIPEFPGVQKIVVQSKADMNHKVVSASSICAKVNRDRIIKSWQFHENKKFIGQLGSGYPSDPTTKNWLEANKHKVFGYPNLIRFSWNTCSTALQNVNILHINDEIRENRYKNLNYMIYGQSQMNRDIFSMLE